MPRIVSFLDSVIRDARHAGRLFAKSPGFVVIAVVSIAFGTGANVAMFSATDALLLRPLAVDHPDQLYTLGTRIDRAAAGTALVASYPDFADIRHRSRTFASFAAFVSRPVGFSVERDAAPRLQVATFVNARFLEALAVVPALGRPFRDEEDVVTGRDPVTILSHGLWQREFAGDPDVIGRTVRMGGIEFTVVGVLPEPFTGVQPRYVRDTAYVPLAMLPPIVESETADPLEARDLRMLTVKARLQPGTSIAKAQAELDRISDELARAYPDTNASRAFVVQTELQVRVAQESFDVGLLLVLSTLSMAVLCVACANVAGLLATRASVRGREIALRLAIGAGRARIVRQLFIESLGIAIAGGCLGVAVGYAGILMLRQIRMPTDTFAYPEFQLDERALVFSLVVAIVSAFLFGLVPAIHTSRTDLITGLRTGEASGGRRPLTGRNALVATQVALSLSLLTIAVWAFQSFSRHTGSGPGFRTTQVAKLEIDASERGTAEAVTQYFDRAVEEARRLPGVTSAAVTSAMPLFSYSPATFVPEGYQPPPGEAGVQGWVNSVHEGYFATLEIPIVLGRAFDRADTATTTRVAIVNETLAGRYWPGRDPIGRRVRMNDAGGPLVEIVGVARNSKYWYFIEPPQNMIYLPFRQAPNPQMVLLAATTSPSAAMLLPLERALQRLDRDVPLSDPQTIETFYRARVTTFAVLAMQMVAAMGLMGVILTTIGLYGLASYAASRRTREIGIRIAIGATAMRVLRMVLRQGMKPAWIGTAAGLLLSAGLMRLLPRLVPSEHATDSLAYLIAVPVLLAVTLLAAFIPARRSSRVDPTVALRCD